MWLSPWCCLWLSGTCTGPGAFETETLGMALLLSPDPMGLWSLSFSWMTGCGFGTLTLGILGGGGGTGVGSVSCGSLGGMAATLGFSMVVADWMILEISCLAAIGATAGACLVGTSGPDMAASLIWTWFLLKTPLCVVPHKNWGSQLFGAPLLEWTTSWLKSAVALPTALVGA